MDFSGQGWLQLGELFLAFLLSALVGLEREIRQKSAGLRTYTLVGVSAALFMLISKYGFMDVLRNDRVVVDPSRVAAQIVSGIGFIGGGVIFMRRDVVRGLITAASVWLTAALGMACGAGLPILAIATTAGHIIIMFVFRSWSATCPGNGAQRQHCGFPMRNVLTCCAALSSHALSSASLSIISKSIAARVRQPIGKQSWTWPTWREPIRSDR
jgi:putative Mg2+ transporter-C (MgtC) family protein